MGGVFLVAVAVLMPLLAVLVEHVGNVRISERHHSHHDTYVVPVPFTRALVLMIVFMGVMGLFLAALCLDDVFAESSLVVLGFFDAFIATSFLLWWVLCRYKVSIFDDRMVVTPFVGREAEVRYADIDRMVWTGFRKGSGYRDLIVWARGRRAARLSGFVDLEQILMSIDRFDALPRA